MKTFEEVFETIPGKGWLSKQEAECLWRWASKVQGPILEVGCYNGRSTCLLAATGRPVFAVDPFAGFDSADPNGTETQASFLDALKERGIENVRLYRQRVEDWTPRTVGFAYLDGDHTYQGTLSQIRKALICGTSVVAVHDVNDGGGGLEIKRAATEQLGEWTERVERLAVWDLRESKR